jgi:hypothetical protein
VDVICTKFKKYTICGVKEDDGTNTQWKCTKNKNGTWSCVQILHRGQPSARPLMNCLMRNVARLRAAKRKTTGSKR